MSPITSAAAKAGTAAACVCVVLFRMHRSRPKDLRSFGLAPPAALPTVAFVAVYLGWMLASDAAIHWRGPWDFRPWQNAPLLASGLRILAVCVLGPAAEELLFRGLIFGWLSDRLPIALVILATAVGWALLHWSYPWIVIGVIVVDGVLLGLARWRTGSIIPPIVMHMLYNLYAIW